MKEYINNTFIEAFETEIAAYNSACILEGITNKEHSVYTLSSNKNKAFIIMSNDGEIFDINGEVSRYLNDNEIEEFKQILSKINPKTSENSSEEDEDNKKELMWEHL